MKKSIFIVLSLSISCCFSQVKPDSIKVQLNLTEQRHTSHWLTSHNQLAKKIQVPDLTVSQDSFHLRVWAFSQAVDVWTSDYRHYTGEVTTFASRYNAKLIKEHIYKVDSVFFKSMKLDSSVAQNIYLAFKNLEISRIPNDYQIKGWDQGLDGEEYLLEYSTSQGYAFREYWTPRFYSNSLQEAKRILKFVTYVFDDLKISSIDTNLKLPNGVFETNGMQSVEIKTTPIYPGERLIDLL